MKLYKLQNKKAKGWLSDSIWVACIVCAASAEEAVTYHPNERDINRFDDRLWVNNLDELEIIYLGVADEGLDNGVILAHFYSAA